MNKKRRAEIQVQINRLDSLRSKINDMTDEDRIGESPEQRVAALRQLAKGLDKVSMDVGSICFDEQNYMDCIPENLQGSEKYDIAESAVDNLENAVQALDSSSEYVKEDNLEEGLSSLEEAIEYLSAATA